MTSQPAVAPVSRFVVPLRQLLDQLDAVLDALDPSAYAAVRPAFMHASVGQHVRHCLDHFQCLLDGRDAGRADYDARQRGTAVESDLAAARAALGAVRQRLGALEGSHLGRPMRIRSRMSADAEPVVCESSLDRELLFLLSHTVHHFALIRTMIESDGVALPAHFGYAPSTLAHQQATDASCVR